MPGQKDKNDEQAIYDFVGIPAFDDLNDAAKAHAEKLIATLDPENMDSVRNFGNGFGGRIEEILKKIKKSSSRHLQFQGMINEISAGLNGIRVDEVSRKTQVFLKLENLDPDADKSGTFLGDIYNSAAGGVLESMGSKAARDAREARKLKKDAPSNFELEEYHREMIIALDRVKRTVAEAEYLLPHDIKTMEELLGVTLNAAKILALHICAGNEKLRRYKEDVLDEAQEAIADGGFIERQQFLKCAAAYEFLGKHVENLLVVRATFSGVAQSVEQNLGALLQVRERLNDHKNTHIPQVTLLIRQLYLITRLFLVNGHLAEANEIASKKLERDERLKSKFEAAADLDMDALEDHSRQSKEQAQKLGTVVGDMIENRMRILKEIDEVSQKLNEHVMNVAHKKLQEGKPAGPANGPQ